MRNQTRRMQKPRLMQGGCKTVSSSGPHINRISERRPRGSGLTVSANAATSVAASLNQHQQHQHDGQESREPVFGLPRDSVAFARLGIAFPTMRAMGLVQRTTSLALAYPPLPGMPALHAIARRNSVCICGTRPWSSIATAPEHSTFLKEVAALEPPASLQSLLNVLQAKGESVVSPYDRKGIIPLAIPLTETQDGEVTALLRWPTPASGMDVPVVRVRSYGVTLLAKSPEEYIHRALVEDDVAGSSGRIAESAGEVGSSLYRRGDFEAAQSSSVDVYLMKKVGLFPDVFERLAMRHCDNGDDISALVTGEYYASKKHFPGFGRPFVFNAELMLKVGRKLEAKDAARCALRSPWWTLGSSYADVASIAGWGEEQIEFMRERVSAEGRREDLLKGKDLAQVAVDQAAFLLDLAAVDCTWDDVREQLAIFTKRVDLRILPDSSAPFRLCSYAR